ncbi:class I SAM-dependent methyltransferase [Parasphingorhabdus sp.]|uniref:class I SAM-dependent methyltransferase n=1 Tax=Parasphingorhabdus sp. TaxID=2709688 RepID=UPI00300303B8
MTEQHYEDWTGEVGDRWLAHAEIFESMISPAGQALMDSAAFGSGETVVDIGCGCGATSFEIAQAVGADGKVLGFDIAPQLVREAEKRAERNHIGNVSFAVGNAETDSVAGLPYDRLFSRFGIMFFDDSVAAFANMRSWLSPGGKLNFACWAGPEENPWMGIIGQIVGQHIDMPEGNPDDPDPFRFADQELVRGILDKAGYANIKCTSWQGESLLGGYGATPESAVDFVMDGLDMKKAIMAQNPGALEDVRSELLKAVRPYHQDNAIRMGAGVWLVSAVNPD